MFVTAKVRNIFNMTKKNVVQNSQKAKLIWFRDKITVPLQP